MTFLKALLAFGLASLAHPIKPGDDLTDFAIHDAANASNTPKYFVEPAGGLARRHYDLRFFKDEVRYDEHHDLLRELIRSYLATMNKYGMETWLAHGTLLGWWWNGQIFPWDDDIDVQVSNHTLQWLGDNLNRTEHGYNYTSAGGELVSKTYLLDVNPHHVDISRGDGSNIIDGRWIDSDNGIFIDITGVREREADRPGFWTCKNQHRYASEELWPLHITKFEGVKCHVPYNFQKILTDEYGAKSLVTEEHVGHRWDRYTKKWAKYLPEGRASARIRLQQAIGTRYKEPPVTISDSAQNSSGAKQHAVVSQPMRSASDHIDL